MAKTKPSDSGGSSAGEDNALDSFREQGNLTGKLIVDYSEDCREVFSSTHHVRFTAQILKVPTLQGRQSCF